MACGLASGPDFLARPSVPLRHRSERHGLEGLVSKRRDTPYRCGACRGWRKIKTTARAVAPV